MSVCVCVVSGVCGKWCVGGCVVSGVCVSVCTCSEWCVSVH